MTGHAFCPSYTYVKTVSCFEPKKVSFLRKSNIKVSFSLDIFRKIVIIQFDSADNSANEYTNGDIYGAGSIDGGASWSRAFNLTNTKTPNCAAGNCLSEHWSSLAQNMYNGNLHIIY
jgi:hypothetical protein